MLIPSISGARVALPPRTRMPYCLDRLPKPVTNSGAEDVTEKLGARSPTHEEARIFRGAWIALAMISSAMVFSCLIANAAPQACRCRW